MWNRHVAQLDLPFSLPPLVCYADTTAKLTLRKKPTEDKTYHLPITIKDNAGMGVARLFEGEFIPNKGYVWWPIPFKDGKQHWIKDRLCSLCAIDFQTFINDYELTISLFNSTTMYLTFS